MTALERERKRTRTVECQALLLAAGVVLSFGAGVGIAAVMHGVAGLVVTIALGAAIGALTMKLFFLLARGGDADDRSS